MRRAVGIAAALLLAAVAVPAEGQAGGGDPVPHLRAIVERSPAPEYRRFGSPGMAAAADYAAGVLAAAGYPVLRHDPPAEVYRPDYRPGHEPLLRRLDDGRTFPVESAFQLQATTSGLDCVVRPVEEVQPGDCGFVPFPAVSPEWKNVLADVGGNVDQVRRRGGVAVVLQGDVRSGTVIALRVRRPIPTVVAVVDEAEILGRRVHLRVEGSVGPATLRNVVAVRPPADPAAGYVLLQGHLDGWFQAAADNGAGAAAVLATAERLAAGGDRRRGLLVALYDGEEWGLQGSEALAADLARGLPVGPACVHLDDVVAVVNLDAPSAVASDLPVRVPLVSWRVLVASEELNLAAAFLVAMAGSGVLGLPVTSALAELIDSGLSRTDALWFHQAGIPVAWPVAGYPEYHTAADTLATVDGDDLRAVTAGATALVRSLDDVAVTRLPGSRLVEPGSRSCEPAAPADATEAAAGEPGAPPATDGDPATVAAASSPSVPGPSLPATGGAVPWVPLAAALTAATTLARWCWPPSPTRRSRTSTSGRSPSAPSG